MTDYDPDDNPITDDFYCCCDIGEPCIKCGNGQHTECKQYKPFAP